MDDNRIQVVPRLAAVRSFQWENVYKSRKNAYSVRVGAFPMPMSASMSYST